VPLPRIRGAPPELLGRYLGPLTLESVSTRLVSVDRKYRRRIHSRAAFNTRTGSERIVRLSGAPGFCGLNDSERQSRPLFVAVPSVSGTRVVSPGAIPDAVGKRLAFPRKRIRIPRRCGPASLHIRTAAAVSDRSTIDPPRGLFRKGGPCCDEATLPAVADIGGPVVSGVGREVPFVPLRVHQVVPERDIRPPSGAACHPCPGRLAYCTDQPVRETAEYVGL